METTQGTVSIRDSWIPNEKSRFDAKRFFLMLVMGAITLTLLYLLVHVEPIYASTHLPGEDASDKLEAAGTLLKILDTGLFKWGARIFAGICIMSAAWSLKEQRFGIAIICVVGAIVFGTAPKWVKNIFDIGDNQSLFAAYQEPIQISGVTLNA